MMGGALVPPVITITSAAFTTSLCFKHKRSKSCISQDSSLTISYGNKLQWLLKTVGNAYI